MASKSRTMSMMVTLILVVLVLSPVLPSAEAARPTVVQELLTKRTICPACVCCEEPPHGSCCRCCASPVETQATSP